MAWKVETNQQGDFLHVEITNTLDPKRVARVSMKEVDGSFGFCKARMEETEERSK